MKSRISMMTGEGRSDEGETGPLVGQGGVGASLASQLNLDLGVNDYIVGQNEEFDGSIFCQ